MDTELGIQTHPPKVSVIIPAYNQAQFLDDALESVFAQTDQEHEIVVVDDGSTDATAAVARQYGEKIRYVVQENLGLAGARNTGIRFARGELLAFLDSDDRWAPDFLEKMRTLTEENPQTAVFFCAAVCMDEKGQPLSQTVGRPPFQAEALSRSLLRANFIIPSTVVARKAAVLKAGGFDPALRSCEDWDLWLRLLAAGYEFQGIPDELVRYRIHGSSLSANVGKMQATYRAVVEKHFGAEDATEHLWSEEKRLTFGGYYRYQLLTNIQRQNDWQGAEFLQKAFQADPTLIGDLSLFYELAFGNQPVGYRGTEINLDLAENGKRMETLLADLFAKTDCPRIQSQRSQIYGTAYQALSLAAYNTGKASLCRKYLWQAVLQRPGLLFEKQVVENFVKSLLGNNGRLVLKKLNARLRRSQ